LIDFDPAILSRVALCPAAGGCCLAVGVWRLAADRWWLAG
jgi:hypothetical protein